MADVDDAVRQAGQVFRMRDHENGPVPRNFLKQLVNELPRAGIEIAGTPGGLPHHARASWWSLSLDFCPTLWARFDRVESCRFRRQGSFQHLSRCRLRAVRCGTLGKRLGKRGRRCRITKC